VGVRRGNRQRNLEGVKIEIIMDKTKEKIAQIFNTINETFPDENDLKGFPGVSRSLILDMLASSQDILVTLKEHDNLFETIILKRELADVFEKIDRDLDERYDKIKAGQFNTFLKHLSRIKFLVKEAYTSIIDGPALRNESEIKKANDELTAILAQIEQLKQVSVEISQLNASTKKLIANIETEITSEGEVAQAVFKSAKEEVSKHKDASIGEINLNQTEIENLKKSAAATVAEIDADKRSTSEHLSVVSQASTDIESSKSSIEEIAKNVDVWKKEIDTCKEEISKNSLDYTALTSKGKNLLEESETTHLKIFGKNDENGNLIKGYFQETGELRDELAAFINEQRSKFQAQFSEIEGLLPGATSAGLAEAYQVQKLSYRRPILIWSITFIFAVSAMAILSATLIYFQFRNSAPQTLNDAFISLLKDLPFFIPTVWLASYASKQQSQYKRLQQEYAFKETNAKSFHGHKMQIEALMKDGVADKDLLLKLLAQLVVITAQNPSETLDSKAHEDNSPILKLVERAFPSLFKKTGETAKDEGKDK